MNQTKLRQQLDSFKSSCGDLASVLLVKRSPWASSDLVGHQLFKIARSDFEELDDESLYCFPEFQEIGDIFSHIELSKEGDQEDYRKMVALLHRLAVGLHDSALNQKSTVHFDLIKQWKIFGVEDWGGPENPAKEV